MRKGKVAAKKDAKRAAKRKGKVAAKKGAARHKRKLATTYEAFDSFLNVDTWHTGHPNADERFYRALHQVVANSDFNPEKMREYMRKKKNIPQEDHESEFAKHIEDRTSNAWAVKDYLEYTR